MLAQSLPVLASPPIKRVMEQEQGLVGKPGIDEVLAYAEKQADKFLKDLAAHLPHEQKDEIRQNARVRVWRAHGKIDRETWKSFIQYQVKGAVKDYLRDGSGFKETRWEEQVEEDVDDSSLTLDSDDASNEVEKTEVDEEAVEAQEPPVCGTTLTEPRKFKQRLTQRVSIVNTDDDMALDVGEVAGIFGIHSGQEESNTFKPNWDLVARMAAVDPEIHLVAKILRGFTQTELAPGFEVTREMLSQRIRIFFDKLDDAEFYHNPWTRQTIYAFGLEDLYHVPHKERGDQGLGWNHDPVDLDSKESLALMSLFDQLEFGF